MNLKNRNTLLLIFILAISFVLHFINLRDLSLSNDELSAITRAKYDSFSEMISHALYIDYHPAGVQIFIYYWVKFFGDDAFLLRIPFVFFAFGSTVLLYLISRKWYNEFVGLLAVMAFTTSSLVLQYTQIARMYSTGMLFSLIATFGWTFYLFNTTETGRKKYWWMWVVGSILCIHNHYFSFAFAGILGLTGIFFVKRKDLPYYLLGGTIAILSFIPELKIFQEQMKTGDIGGWLGAPEKTFLLDFFYDVFNKSILYIGIILLWIICGIVFPVKSNHLWRWRILSMIWFLFVFLLAYLYSVYSHPVIQFSTLLFPLPFVFIFIFSFTPRFVLKYQLPVLTMFLFIGFFTLITSGFYKKNHFGVFKEIAEDVNGFPENVPVVVNIVNPVYFDYYYSKIKTKNRAFFFKLESPKDYARLIQIVDTCKSNEFGYAWTNNFHPYEINEIIRTKYPYLKTKKIYFNATSYLFSKTPCKSQSDSILFSYFNDYEDSLLNSTVVNDEVAFSGKKSEWMDSTKQYSSTKIINLDEIPETEMRYAAFSAKVYFEKMPEKASLVLTFEDSTHSYKYQVSAFKDYCREAGKWYTIMTSAEFPKQIKKSDQLKAFFYNPGGEKFRIDDFKLIVRTTNDPYLK